MTAPIAFMMIHRDEILDVYRDTGKSPKATWDRLQESLPEITGAMKENSFRQYLSVFAALSSEIQEVTHKLDELEKENAALRERLDTVRQAAKKVDGWNVQRSKDGYFRLFRKIRGKVRSIYLGKVFDEEKAKRLIHEKEKQLDKVS